MAGKHALLSPSKAHQWHACNGSIKLSEGVPNRSNKYAAEGTAGHAIAAKALDMGVPVTAFLGRTITVEEEDATYQIPVTEEMCDLLKRGYISHAEALYEQRGGQLLVEQPLPLFHITQESDAQGTSDLVFIPDDWRAHPVHVGDLKYGRGIVPAHGNLQGAMYIAGVIEKFKIAQKWVYNQTIFEFAIYQPKVSLTPDVWTIPWAELDVDYLIPLQRSAWRIMNDIPDKRTALLHLTPGEKQCEWCPARDNCPALAKQVYAPPMAIAHESAFGDESKPNQAAIVDNIPPAQLGEIIQKATMIRNFLDACEERAFREAMNGNPVPGTKLILGKPGSRAWSDEKLLAQTIGALAENSADFSPSDCFETKIKSPAQMEKALKKAPNVWHELIPLIARSDPQPKLALASDKNPEYFPSAALQFADESATINPSVSGADLL